MNSAITPKLVRFGVFELDLRTGELRKAGSKVRIQEQPFRVLATLLERPGEIVSREDLQHKIWNTDTFVDFDTGLNKAITKIREALDDSADSPRFIETMPRRGYRFIARVESAPVEPVAAEVQVTRPNRRLVWTAAVMAALAGATVIAWQAGRFGRPTYGSIAVLPLQNLSGDPAQEYFADGMTDELITDLAQIHSLRVISRTSVMQFKQTKKTLPEIARELRVDAVVEGSVLMSGDSVRVTAQLLDAKRDGHLWAASYERRIADVVGMQRQVAQAIADQVRANITPAEHANLARQRPANPDAYQAMLKGRFFLNKRNGPAIRKAIGYFREAVDLDPTDAQAWAGLAGCYASLGADLGVELPASVYPLAKAAIAKSLALDPDLAEAHLTSGWLKLWYVWDWKGAEAEFRRAIELNPNDSPAHRLYSHYLSQAKRFEEALAENRRAIDLAPLDTLASIHLAWIYADMRQPEKAVEQCLRVLEMDSGFIGSYLWLGRAYEQEGKWSEAMAAYEKAKELYAVSYQVGMARVLALAGKKQEAAAALLRLRELTKETYVSQVSLASIYSAMGQRDAALDQLEQAYELRATGLIALAVGNTFDGVRDTPRFQRLLTRVGLPR